MINILQRVGILVEAHRCYILKLTLELQAEMIVSCAGVKAVI